MDEEEYINIENLVIKRNVYQIQLKKDSCVVVLVGECEEIPEIIIEENFGKDKKYSLYSMVYEKDEITKKENNFLPLIRLVDKKDKIVYSVCIRYSINENLEIESYEKYFSISTNKENIYKKIDKEIDKENIVESLLEMVIEQGIIIY